MLQMIITNGLVYGGVYAMLAVGFTLIFGVAKILNMAHTAFYMVCAFTIYSITSLLGFSLLPSSLLSILFTTILGIIFYKFLFDPVKVHENAVLIVSIALANLLQEIIFLIYAGHFRKNPSIIEGYFEIAGIRILSQHLIVLGGSFLCLAFLWWMLTKTRLGNAIRAIADDRETANLMGINVGRMCMVTMGISAALAGIAAAVVGPLFVVEPTMWVHPLIMTLAIVVLGGVGSVKGSVIAAFILAFSETSVVFLIPGGAFLRGAVSLSAMVIVLLIRPEGLFGVLFEEERL